MPFLVYLAGAVGFLFLFFFAMDRTGDSSLFQYIGYMSLLIVFYFLTLGIRDAIDSEREKQKKMQDAKREKYANYKKDIQSRWRRK